MAARAHFDLAITHDVEKAREKAGIVDCQNNGASARDCGRNAQTVR